MEVNSKVNTGLGEKLVVKVECLAVRHESYGWRKSCMNEKARGRQGWLLLCC